MPLAGDVSITSLANTTYGFVGADLEALVKEAAMSALRRNLPGISWKKSEQLDPKMLEKLKVTKVDFENAQKLVEPSAMREVMIEVPNVRWEDVGGLDEIKGTLNEMIEWPLKHPKSFERIGIRPPAGILLYGPPGCGKTLLAKAVATEAGANFISIKGPEVLTMWVGESERKVREIFRRAKQVAPSIIFFDEIDSLAPKRGLELGTRVTENIVSQILTEMSGLEDMHNVVVIAATNRPDMLDSAIMRPGRFDRQVLVPAPDADARQEIFNVHTKKMPVDKKVNLKSLAKETEGYSGADIEAVVREAGLNALREDMKASSVKKKHFDDALKKIRPSIDQRLIDYYEKMIDRMRSRAAKAEKREDTDYVG
jgi:transitional endoplasmic reticulum ATPase